MNTLTEAILILAVLYLAYKGISWISREAHTAARLNLNKTRDELVITARENGHRLYKSAVMNHLRHHGTITFDDLIKLDQEYTRQLTYQERADKTTYKAYPLLSA